MDHLTELKKLLKEYFEEVKKSLPTNSLLALKSVATLDAALEYIRSLHEALDKLVVQKVTSEGKVVSMAKTLDIALEDLIKSIDLRDHNIVERDRALANCNDYIKIIQELSIFLQAKGLTMPEPIQAFIESIPHSADNIRLDKPRRNVAKTPKKNR